MQPADAAFYADVILYLHIAIVAANILPVPIIVMGACKGWRFVHSLWFRIGHILMMAIVAAQAWMGELCPLTIWERRLREMAGDVTYQGAFISHWMQELLYIDAPAIFFTALYSGWLILIAALLYFVPIHIRSTKTKPPIPFKE